MPISFLHLSPFMPSSGKAKLCQFLQMPTVFEDINCVTPPQYKQCWKTSKWFHDGTKNIFFFPWTLLTTTMHFDIPCSYYEHSTHNCIFFLFNTAKAY